MARPLRVEYEGRIYHISVRVRVFLFCLLRHHFHCKSLTAPQVEEVVARVCGVGVADLAAHRRSSWV